MAMEGNMKILQKHALRVAGRIFRTGNLAHAWLLAGQEGTGKEELARRMASLLMCRTPVLEKEYPESCGMCSHCGKLFRHTHPDMVVIEPDGAFIKLPQIHGLQKNISFSPLESRNRVILLLHAHRMNREAANALLKTLEEPPDRTFLILTASSADALLPTIVSRCQMISCGGLDAEDITEILLDDSEVSPEEAEVAARLADGSLLRARAVLEQGMDFRDLFFRFATLPVDRRFSLFFDVSKVMSSGVDEFMLALAVIRAVVRDLIVFRMWENQGPESCGDLLQQQLNRDMADKLESMVSEFTLERLLSYARGLEEMERLSGRNVNREMLANALLLFFCET